MDAPAGSASGRSGSEASEARDWELSLIAAAVVFTLAYLGFVIVPNALATSHYLSTRLVARAHDAVVLAWVAAFFVFQSWLFVRVQGWLEGRRSAIRS